MRDRFGLIVDRNILAAMKKQIAQARQRGAQIMAVDHHINHAVFQ